MDRTSGLTQLQCATAAATTDLEQATAAEVAAEKATKDLEAVAKKARSQLKKKRMPPCEPVLKTGMDRFMNFMVCRADRRRMMERYMCKLKME